MEKLFYDILSELRAHTSLPHRRLEQILRAHNKARPHGTAEYTKRMLVPYYLKIKRYEPEIWDTWNIDDELEARLLTLIQMKPRRTASGVATITVITKPWPCSGSCLYCPNDMRMPKSYLADEPACQRAEYACFDPYLQVASRLEALIQMGHVTDKIELIILGGTWCEYPQDYQLWYICEIFQALSDSRRERLHKMKLCEMFYLSAHIPREPKDCADTVASVQKRVNKGELTYNEAWRILYGKSRAWDSVSFFQTASLDDVLAQHVRNETSRHRVVGLAVEVRPSSITPASLTFLRQIGCTKIQIGVQSTNERILYLNDRTTGLLDITRAFALLRVFGFKIHAHSMVNLLGATPESDKAEYERFVRDPAFLPDEIKLYPTALLESSRLMQNYADGSWQPYSEATLVDILAHDVSVTPAYMRISRMIRDFSSNTIVAGNKKVNLRQSVEHRLRTEKMPVQEIRYRELACTRLESTDELILDDVVYQSSCSCEHFLQWITPDNKIVGFLRLSLPSRDFIEQLGACAPVGYDEAMVRELHVYGRVTDLSHTSKGAQHLGLGTKLLARASEIARQAGYTKLNVISSVGTRPYYRERGFEDRKHSLYQTKVLE